MSQIAKELDENDDGYREILGAKIADSESNGFWSGFSDELIDRGLRDVRLVIIKNSDRNQSSPRNGWLPFKGSLNCLDN